MVSSFFKLDFLNNSSILDWFIIFHRIFMHKILIFTFLILLVWCSLQDKEKIWSIPTQYSDKNIEGILWYMEINKEIDPREYHAMHDLLTKVETPCMGKWFREYRECFISNLEQGERNLKIDQKSRDQLSSLKRSIRDKIVYFEYYKELDDAPLLEYSNNEKLNAQSLVILFSPRMITHSLWFFRTQTLSKNEIR